ncbi:uncharacterized protein LOC106058920 [Biomphalaria glabrata]|uniref:Poly [ADP-ribose] polymerase n=1 Tax=Biomphalaria glabrata TaxID=6526 RepID=A0A9W3BJL5_BIOGL|nr:uncharacterized protein LOC106058920 [Biomphalaria glabrata]XP_055899616.1 uncharacterized protein LOC106058920 [Biomphalaria glabrata]XP_055899617.1 uncharacterized protein LOC106058920 [Biomphalaria glabrata]XP_055899618.1 uncharacterized protein LOC106058920 [Biomphalaria glabrata]
MDITQLFTAIALLAVAFFVYLFIQQYNAKFKRPPSKYTNRSRNVTESHDIGSNESLQTNENVSMKGDVKKDTATSNDLNTVKRISSWSRSPVNSPRNQSSNSEKSTDYSINKIKKTQKTPEKYLGQSLSREDLRGHKSSSPQSGSWKSSTLSTSFQRQNVKNSSNVMSSAKKLQENTHKIYSEFKKEQSSKVERPHFYPLRQDSKTNIDLDNFLTGTAKETEIEPDVNTSRSTTNINFDADASVLTRNNTTAPSVQQISGNLTVHLESRQTLKSNVSSSKKSLVAHNTSIDNPVYSKPTRLSPPILSKVLHQADKGNQLRKGLRSNNKLTSMDIDDKENTPARNIVDQLQKQFVSEMDEDDPDLNPGVDEMEDVVETYNQKLPLRMNTKLKDDDNMYCESGTDSDNEDMFVDDNKAESKFEDDEDMIDEKKLNSAVKLKKFRNPISKPNNVLLNCKMDIKLNKDTLKPTNSVSSGALDLKGNQSSRNLSLDYTRIQGTPTGRNLSLDYTKIQGTPTGKVQSALTNNNQSYIKTRSSQAAEKLCTYLTNDNRVGKALSSEAKSSQPIDCYGEEHWRKILNRVSQPKELKVYITKHVPVSNISNSKESDKSVGVKFRRNLTDNNSSVGPEVSSAAKKTLGFNKESKKAVAGDKRLEDGVTSESNILKKKAKLNSGCDSTFKDNTETINKPLSKKVTVSSSPTKEKELVTKRKERWSLKKEQMKNKSLQLKSGETRNINIPIEMDFNSIEVSGMCCDICKSLFLCQECTWCPNNHRICLNCMKLAIKDTLDNKKLHLACPIHFCQAIINPDLISKKIDPLTFEILHKKLQKRLDKAQAEMFERLFGKISCPQCHFLQVLDYEEIHFKCKNCHMEFCSYCLQSWSVVSSTWSSYYHNECRLLNYSGQKCFRNSDQLPSNWRKSAPVLSGNDKAIVDVDVASEVDLNSNEGRTVIQLFNETLQGVQVTAIIRLQNIKLWEKYVLKRKHMVEELGLANIKERALFHGTDEKNISLICQEGFDMRVKTANGAVYGKGIYFSTTSKYSLTYAHSSNKMFIARVLCGLSTKGSSDIFRPPKDPRTGRMYDSCVNNLDKPTIYSLFDNGQCYPAYVVSFKN